MTDTIFLACPAMTETEIQSYRYKITALLESAPSDANSRSEILRNKQEGFTGILEIASSQGKFVVESTAAEIEALVSSLLHLMFRQVRNWRTRRFLTARESDES